MSIVVVGSINVDLVLKCERAPEAGETLAGLPNGFSVGVGGKGLNQCAATALQSLPGSRVSMVACTGDDAYGEMCRKALSDTGVNVDKVQIISATSTGIAMIVVERNGQNRILLSSGANEQLSRTHIDRCSEMIQAAALAVFQLETPLETVLYAMKVAHSSGVKTVLNPAPAMLLSDDILGVTSYLVPNETEAALLVGLPVTNISQAIEAGQNLLARGVKEAVVITLGSAGCVLVSTGNEPLHIAAEKAQAIDTTA